MRQRPVEPLALFALLFVVYLANCGFLVGHDSTPNVYLPISLFREGNLSFTPREAPSFFEWSYLGARGPERVAVPDLEALIAGRPARELLERKELKLRRVPYFLVPTRFDGYYVGIYGPGPGLAALPLFAALHLVFGDLDARPGVLWFGAKVAAAAMVAASGSLVLLAGLRLGARRDAWVVALCYGLGTGTWSVTSQALWQQAPALLCVALGTLLLLLLHADREPDRGRALACGLAWGAAALCRPANALLVAAAGLFVAWRHRPLALAFAAGAATSAAPLLLFNFYYLGSPFETGQAIGIREVAKQFGDSGVWRSDSIEGALGLLISPSRGLFVYSPLFLLALVGLRRAWRSEAFAPLWALCVACALLFAMHASYFRWWGGWSFGPRYLLDLMPILVLWIVPALPALRARPAALAAGALIALSIGVQAIGAFAYDVDGWNNRRTLIERRNPQRHILLGPSETPDPAARRPGAYSLVRLDVDRAANYGRLWSIVDSPLVYYVSHFEASRREKGRGIRSWIRESPRMTARPAPTLRVISTPRR